MSLNTSMKVDEKQKLTDGDDLSSVGHQSHVIYPRDKQYEGKRGRKRHTIQQPPPTKQRSSESKNGLKLALERIYHGPSLIRHLLVCLLSILMSLITTKKTERNEHHFHQMKTQGPDRRYRKRTSKPTPTKIGRGGIYPY